MELKAFCFSVKCCGQLSFTKPKVPKDVPRGTKDCPDCGAALFWTRNKNAHTNRKNKKSFP